VEDILLNGKRIILPALIAAMKKLSEDNAERILEKSSVAVSDYEIMR